MSTPMQKIVSKPCSNCGKDIPIFKNGRRATPSGYERSKYCSRDCEYQAKGKGYRKKDTAATTTLTKRISKLTEQVDALNKLVGGDGIIKMKANNHTMQVYALRWSVLTELVWYATKTFPEVAGKIAIATIKAQENSDGWWWDKRNWEISEWMDYLYPRAA